MARILCYTLNPAFDLAMDLAQLQPGQVHRAQSSRLEPAGKGINVGRVLRQLGHEVRLSGFLGQDNAAPFAQLFRDEGLENAFIEVAGATRINVKLAEADGRVSDINGPGIHIDAAAWQDLQAALPSQLQAVDAVVVSGSLPPGVEVAAFATWLQALAASGRPLYLDTSGSGLAAARQARVTLLKPNEDELAQLLARALPESGAALSHAAQQVLDAGWAEQVLLSLGADGACWVTAEGVLAARPPKLQVQNTVCAGDTLLAAALHGQLLGWPRAQSLRFAVALAAECVRHVGPGHPQAADFEHLLAQVQMDGASSKRSAPEKPE